MLDVLGQVQAAWVDVLAAEAAITVADERIAVAQRLEREVARRVGGALDPLFAGERAHTAVAQARIAREQGVENARIGRASNAAWWGGGQDVRIDARTFCQAADMETVGEDIVD